MTRHAIPGMVNATRPTAEQVVDGEHQAVLIDLAPVATSLLTDLGRALHASRATWRLRALGILDPTETAYTRQLAALLADPAVMEALQVLISAADADHLAEDLDVASVARDNCLRDTCLNLETDGDLCEDHRQLAEGLRVVS